jgi:hypothetical protein
VAVTEDADEQVVNFRHVLICDSVHHDATSPGQSYTLKGLMNWLMPQDEFGYPLVVERIVLFAQVWGSRAEHRLTIDLVRLEENDEVWVASFGPRSFPVYGNEFVESQKWTLHQVCFPIPGLYEFRLFVDNQDSVSSSERILLLSGQ